VRRLRPVYKQFADKQRLFAANHFAGLVLWAPVNRVTFCGDEEQLTAEEIDRYAEAAVHAFLAAYGPV
jgi:TetR/AcrR family transcriptional repressor of mexJK operon